MSNIDLENIKIKFDTLVNEIPSVLLEITNSNEENSSGKSFFDGNKNIDFDEELYLNELNWDDSEQFETEYNWTGKTILVVEDEETNFFLINEILTDAKATVIWAQDGSDAIEYCKNNKDIDLVLMDLKLPHVSGFEAVPAIRKFRPNIPIIAQTAYAMINDKQKAMEIGCDDYIAKPINIEMFFIKVNRYLSTKV